MTKFLCDDGNAEIEIEADTAEDAAQEYVDGGDWNQDLKTIWIDVYVQEVDEEGEAVGDRQCITITVDPEEPPCPRNHEHDWQSPHEIVGGLSENPGVRGHGGGVTIEEVCMHCGCSKTTDTWAQRPDTGEQGLDSVEYEPRKYQDEVDEYNEALDEAAA